jgi:hypothetical protein
MMIATYLKADIRGTRLFYEIGMQSGLAADHRNVYKKTYRFVHVG